MTSVKTTLIQKGHQKGNILSNNYRLITSLPMMLKIRTTQIKKEIYNLLSRELLPKEQKGCCKRTRTGLYIDQYILQAVKKRRKYLTMACIEYKPSHDMVSQTWVI